MSACQPDAKKIGVLLNLSINFIRKRGLGKRDICSYVLALLLQPKYEHFVFCIVILFVNFFQD